MRVLKLTKKIRHLILVASTATTVLCLTLVLSSNDQQATITQNLRQSELLLFCAGLSSVVAFELAGQSINSRAGKTDKKKTAPFPLISSSISPPIERFQPTKVFSNNEIRWMILLLACGVSGLTGFLLSSSYFGFTYSIYHNPSDIENSKKRPIILSMPAVPDKTKENLNVLLLKPDGSLVSLDELSSNITLSSEEVEAFQVLEGLSQEETEALQIILEAQEKKRELQQVEPSEPLNTMTDEADPETVIVPRVPLTGGSR